MSEIMSSTKANAATDVAPPTVATPDWVQRIFDEFGCAVPPPVKIGSAADGSYLVVRKDDVYSFWEGFVRIDGEYAYASAKEAGYDLDPEGVNGKRWSSITNADAWLIGPKSRALTRDECGRPLADRICIVNDKGGHGVTREGIARLTGLNVHCGALDRAGDRASDLERSAGPIGVACDRYGALVIKVGSVRWAATGASVPADTPLWPLTAGPIDWFAPTDEHRASAWAEIHALAAAIIADGPATSAVYNTPRTGVLRAWQWRGKSGTWSGAIAVNPLHPWYGKVSSDPAEFGVKPGTSISLCAEATAVQEDVLTGRQRCTWLIGFDCMSGVDDMYPAIAATQAADTAAGRTYKSFEYAHARLIELIDGAARAYSVSVSSPSSPSVSIDNDNRVTALYLYGLDVWRHRVGLSAAPLTTDDVKLLLKPSMTITEETRRWWLTAHWGTDYTHIVWAWAGLQGRIAISRRLDNHIALKLCYAHLGHALLEGRAPHAPLMAWLGSWQSDEPCSNVVPISALDCAPPSMQSPWLGSRIDKSVDAWLVNSACKSVMGREWKCPGSRSYVVGYADSARGRAEWRMRVAAELRRHRSNAAVPRDMPLIVIHAKLSDDEKSLDILPDL